MVCVCKDYITYTILRILWALRIKKGGRGGTYPYTPYMAGQNNHKLTPEQRKEAVALYASGRYSYAELAAKYGVPKSTIYSIVQSDPGFQTVANGVKKAAEEKAVATLSEFIEKNHRTAVNLMGRLLDIPDALLAKSTLYERMGAVKTLRDVFTEAEGKNSGREALDKLCAAISQGLNGATVEDDAEGEQGS